MLLLVFSPRKADKNLAFLFVVYEYKMLQLPCLNSVVYPLVAPKGRFQWIVALLWSLN